MADCLFSSANGNGHVKTGTKLLQFSGVSYSNDIRGLIWGSNTQITVLCCHGLPWV